MAEENKTIFSLEEIMVLKHLSDGKEHFDRPDIEDYDDICEHLEELGLVDRGETMDNGPKLTYLGKKKWQAIVSGEGMTKLEYKILDVISLHGKEINPSVKDAPQIYDYEELRLYTKEEITQFSKIMKAKGWIHFFIDGGPAYWHKITSAGRIALRNYLDEHPELSTERLEDKMDMKNMTNKIFIVHGHDEGMKQAVARSLEQQGLEPIILSEQPNSGRTIIEKFEEESNVGFAVVLMSDQDDHGAEVNCMKLKPRARQNVILELGYFIGKLGRRKVFVLRKGDVEIPSDILGVVYQSYDDAGAWRYNLCDELSSAGYDVDKNKIK